MATSDVELNVGLKAANVEAAAEELRQKLDKLFKEVEGKPTNDRIQSILTSLRAASELMEEMPKDIDSRLLSAGTMTPEYSKVIDDISAVQVKLDGLTQQLKTQKDYAEALKLSLAQVEVRDFGTASYGKLRNDLKAITDQYAELDKSRVMVESKMNSLDTAIQQNISAMNGLYAAAKKTGEPELWSQWGKQAYYVRTLKQEYANLTPQYTQITQRQAELNDLAERYAEGMQQVYTSTKRTYSTDNKQRIYSTKATIENTTQAIKNQQRELDNLQREKNRLKDNGLDFDNSKNVKEASKFTEELNSIVNHTRLNMDKLNQEFEKMPQIVDLTKGPVRSLSEMLIQAFRTAGTAIENTLDGVVRTMPPIFQVAYGVVKAGVKLIIGEIINTAKQVAGVIKNTVIKALNIATTAAKNFAKTLAKVASNTLLSPLKKFGDVIGGIGKKATESDFSMKKFGRAILQYGIGVRSLYRLINKLRTALFEGFADLALAYEPFNDSMSQIITALNYLKNSFAAAFAPIIEYVAPVLSIFVTKVAEAVQWIGQLIAALTGKEFVMALPVFKDYSEETKAGAAAAREQAQAEKQAKKAAEDEAKAEKKRNKALEKLQKTIAGFDDVELLKDNTSDDDDDNYGFDPDKYDFSTPTLDAALQTFRVGGPIQAGIQQFADLLKKAWKTADAYDLGKLISQQLGNLLRAFNRSIPDVQARTTKIAKLIASFLAGFLSVNDTFKVLGVAIRNTINTIFLTIQEFLKTFMAYDGFKNLGRDIYYTIVNALSDINWDVIYDVFRMMGIGIAQVLNETITREDFWTSIFTTLTNALRAILIRVYAFSTELHWGEIGSALAAGVVAGIENFPLEEAINAVVAVLDGLWQLFINFVEGMEGHWYDIGHTIASFIIGLFEHFEPIEFANGVIDFLDGLWEAFMGFVETPGWDQVVDKVATAIGEFFSKFEWEKKADYLLEFLNNTVKKLKEKVDKVDLNKLFDEIVNYLENNKDFMELCDNVVDLIVKFVGAAIHAKGGLFMFLGKLILKHIFTGWENDMDSNAYKAAEQELEALGVETKKRTGDAEDVGANIGDAVNRGLGNQLSNITNTAGDINTATQDEFKKGDYGLIWSEHGSSMLTGIDNFKPQATGAVKEVSDEMQVALASGDWEEVMRVNAQSGATGISNNSYLVTDEVGTMTQSISDIFANMDWSIIGNGLIDGIYYGLSNGWGWLCDTVWNLATDLLNSAKNALGIASPSKVFREAVGKMIPAGIGIGIEANANSALGAVDDLSTGLVKTAKNIKIPPIAMGEVIPYNIANGQNDSTQSTLKSLVDMLQLQQSEMVTNESLMRAIALIIENMPDFYIGPEKLARIVKQGNTQLNRRYGY